MGRCILVVGTPRSGTSAVAGVLHHLGVPMGPSIPANEWNPAGFFQDREFEEAASSLLGQEPFPIWSTSRMAGGEIVRDLIANRARQSLWGLKTNRASYFLSWILDASPDVRVIQTSRRGAASTDSLAARTQMSSDDARSLIEHVAAATDSALQQCGISPSLTVDYDELLSDPLGQVKKIADVAELPSTNEAINWVNADLRRFA